MKFYFFDSNVDFYWDFVDIVLCYGLLNDINLYGFKVCEVLCMLIVFFMYL